MKNLFTIFKIEEYDDKETGERLIVLFCANKKERIAFIIEDFLNFTFLELPPEITKEKCKKIMNGLFPDSDSSQWSYKKWEKYSDYPPKKTPFLVLYGTDMREHIKAINDFFIKEGKKEFPNLPKKELKKLFSCKEYYNRFTLTQKFSAIKKINVGEWFEIEDYVVDENYAIYCRIPAARISIDDIKPCSPPSSDDFPTYKITCIDFEVNSHRKGKFPDPWEPPDLIYLISYVHGFQGMKNEKEGILITTVNSGIKEIRDLKNSKPSPVEVYENDEIACLRRLEQYIIDTDPDFIITYNGDSFDFPFWKARYDREGETLGNFGRLIDKSPVFRRNDWASSAIKSRGQELLVVPGRITIDLYSIIRRERFYDLYTLKHVSEQILRTTDSVDGEDVGAKDDLSAEEQFRIYREGTKEEWYRLLHYSLRDSFTPLRIIDKIGTINNIFAMARIIGINIEEIYTRGQQHRLENRIFQDRIQNKVVLDPKRNVKFKKFKGAVVQSPLLKLMRNVATLDFQSLYPSIIIAYNISHDTYIGSSASRIPDDLTMEDVNVIEVDDRKHYFVKSSVKLGTIPKLLAAFLASRNEKKALMKKERDEVLHSILDGEQNALKVIANSFYGFLGAADGKLPFKEGAESVTAMGRKLITQVVHILRDEYKAIIVYGDTDSVFFTFDEWQPLRGIENIKKMMTEVEKIGDYVTKTINTNPIKIVLDHFYTHYLVQTKKCYLANEVASTPEGLKVKLSFRGVLNARREHCRWSKELYAKLSTTAIGSATFDDDEYQDMEKLKICEEIILEHVLDLMELRTPAEHLLKIVQMGDNYKNKSYPLYIFGEREKENGRPISPGERFRYWIVKGPKGALIGSLYRRALEDGDVIDRSYYVDKLSTAINRLMTGVFSNNDFFNLLLKQIKRKENLLNEIKEWGDFICPQPLSLIRKSLLKLQHKEN